MKLATLLIVSLGVSPCHAETLLVRYVDQEVLQKWVALAKAKNADRMEQVRQLFQTAGCEPQAQKVSGSKLTNLICELPGPEDSIILVGAHFDKVDKSDGVIDNWSGAAMLPALYQALKGETRRHKILFVAFADEEKGLYGSKHYVAKLKKEARKAYTAMVNIDSVGAGPVSIWAGGRNDPELTKLVSHVANSLQIDVGQVNLDQVGLGDSFPFHDEKIRTIDFHSITNATWPLLHTPKDNAQALVFEEYWKSYRLIATYLAYLDLKL
ncbi:MAG: Zn-dependent exopeptidase M28 [Bryobacteraceae bacterium]|nr:Zn-dependent exopeptidase M28 [Bryobacteraceae bacterium]